jgi:Rieske Fe-S protein
VTNEPTTADVETVAELPTRRAAFAVAAGGCVLAVAGCSSYGEDAAAVVSSQPNEPAGEGGDPAASGEEGDSEQKSTKSIAAVADIPVGGGMILKKQGVVLTQPTKGKIKAFSVTCTHAGCAVTKVNDGSIDCACHGSKFAIEDGAPTDGPAKTPLEKVSVKVKSKKVYLA